MVLREATEEDIEGIREVAKASLLASYGHAVDEEIIDEAVERWYDAEELKRELNDTNAIFFVALEDGDIAGFAQSYVVERRETVGEIDWLHVAPDHRGGGVGSDLLAEIEQALLERGVERIEGRVLEANAAGTGFYDARGFDQTGETTVDIGGEEFVEEIYTKFPEGSTPSQVLLEQRVTEDGTTLYIAYDEEERASVGPFFRVYLDRDREDAYGWYCGACESFDTAMDAMGRIECSDCGNRKKATRWDAAYL